MENDKLNPRQDGYIECICGEKLYLVDYINNYPQQKEYIFECHKCHQKYSTIVKQVSIIGITKKVLPYIYHKLYHYLN